MEFWYRDDNAKQINNDNWNLLRQNSVRLLIFIFYEAFLVVHLLSVVIYLALVVIELLFMCFAHCVTIPTFTVDFAQLNTY